MTAANSRPSGLVLVPILSDEWEIPRDELKVFDKEPLGKGCFGEVHKGLLAGQTTRKSVLGTTRSSRFSLACTVAVKKLKSKNCILMLRHLTSIHITQCIYVYYECTTPYFCMLLTWCVFMSKHLLYGMMIHKTASCTLVKVTQGDLCCRYTYLYACNHYCRNCK